MDWKDYFIEITKLVAKKSTCIRRGVGAIAVIDKRIIATGYNGAPVDLKHCDEVGCLRHQLNIPSGTQHEICRGVHAEQNLIIQCALYGVSIKGADIYCTHSPCVQCMKMLVNCKVSNIYYFDDYPDTLAMKLATEANISVARLSV